MACGCQKNKANVAAANATVSKPVASTRPLSEGGRTRRAEKRIIR